MTNSLALPSSSSSKVHHLSRPRCNSSSSHRLALSSPKRLQRATVMTLSTHASWLLTTTCCRSSRQSKRDRWSRLRVRTMASRPWCRKRHSSWRVMAKLQLRFSWCRTGLVLSSHPMKLGNRLFDRRTINRVSYPPRRKNLATLSHRSKVRTITIR